MKIKIDPKLAKAGLTILGVAFTGIGKMITDAIQEKSQREAMVEIAKEVFKEGLKDQVKGS